MNQMVMVPRLKPAAADTWELRGVLENDQELSPRFTIEFPGPTTVVGAYVSVIPYTDDDLDDATADDLLVLVDLDNRTQFTSGPTQAQTTQAARGSQFVTLNSLDTRYRDLYWELTSARPVLGMTFQWKRFVAGGSSPLYEDALISVALYTLPGIQVPRP